MKQKSPSQPPRHWPEIEAGLRLNDLMDDKSVALHRRVAYFLDPVDPRTMTQPQLDELKRQIRDNRNLKTHNTKQTYMRRLKTILKRVYMRTDLTLKVQEYVASETLPPSPEQLATILAELQQRYPIHYAGLLLMHDACMRPGEVVTVDLRDVNLKDRTIAVPQERGKTGQYTRDLTERSVAALEAWLKMRNPKDPTEKALFLNKHGTRPSPEHFFNNPLKECAEAVGYEGRIYPNLLRSAVISHMLSNNTNPLVVQRFARHKKWTTTQLYSRLSKEDEKKLTAQALDRLTPAPLKGPPSARKPAIAHKEIGDALARGEIGPREAANLLATLELSKVQQPEARPGYA